MSVDVPRVLDALGIQYRSHCEELWGPCPCRSHLETKPSWSIRHEPASSANGLHYCFGCGFTGGPIDLVAEVLGGVSYSHAKSWLTDKGLWLKGAVPLEVELEVRVGLSKQLAIPKGLLGGPLEKWVTPARRYATARGVTAEQVMHWRIMYATCGSMAGRIVFPLRDATGQWKSFHARTYSNQDKRYKNASTADRHDPGAVFGMEHWPPVVERRNLTLTFNEGTLDSLACERAGAAHLCAIGGSQLHPRQLLKLSSWGRIVCATDGDKAGHELAEAVRVALARTSTVVRAPIPDGSDAAKLETGVLKEVLNAAES